ncbi:HNH endonuclease [Gordonia cholesterolivorans]|uniref:HNH domain-containing protein n=1 Tax=Gordonia cholesterolivorans TaxID=559625 RepID=A0ABN3I3W3_9ACTN
MSTNRNTTIRDRHRRIIARNKPPCAWAHCLYPGIPIDYDAGPDDPLSYVVDHRIPLNKGGSDTLDNKDPFHRACNRAKSDHLPDEEPPGGIRIHVTKRTW